jgi:hypothetical protein
LTNGLLRGSLFRLGYDGLLATIERGADGIAIKPYVKLYTAAELKRLLSQFRRTDIKAAHFTMRQIPVLWRVLPARLERLLEPLLGWYLAVNAQK